MGSLAASLVLLVLAALATGTASYAWADFLWRRWRERWQEHPQLSFKSADRKLIAMTLMLFFGAGFAICVLWAAGERFLVSSTKATSVTGNSSAITEANQGADRPSRRTYPPVDREEISLAIAQISTLLNKPTAAIEKESQELVRLWEAKKYSSTDPSRELKYLIERLEALRPVSSEAWQGIEKAFADFPRRRDLLQEILQLPQVEREQPVPNWQYASNDLHRAVSTYLEIYNKIDPRAREGFVVTANPVQTNFMNATAKLNAWIHESNQRMKAVEQEIFR